MSAAGRNVATLGKLDARYRNVALFTSSAVARAEFHAQAD
jgi:hypothetical protein